MEFPGATEADINWLQDCFVQFLKDKVARLFDDNDDDNDNDKVGEEIDWKKNVFFRALPELPKPPPWPQFRQLGPLFSEVKIQDLKVILELKILYILYDILHICNLKNS